jgi:hypothetical protein
VIWWARRWSRRCDGSAEFGREPSCSEFHRTCIGCREREPPPLIAWSASCSEFQRTCIGCRERGPPPLIAWSAKSFSMGAARALHRKFSLGALRRLAHLGACLVVVSYRSCRTKATATSRLKLARFPRGPSGVERSICV